MNTSRPHARHTLHTELRQLRHSISAEPFRAHPAAHPAYIRLCGTDAYESFRRNVHRSYCMPAAGRTVKCIVPPHGTLPPPRNESNKTFPETTSPSARTPAAVRTAKYTVPPRGTLTPPWNKSYKAFPTLLRSHARSRTNRQCAAPKNNLPQGIVRMLLRQTHRFPCPAHPKGLPAE